MCYIITYNKDVRESIAVPKMSIINVGINGFTHRGKMIMRACLENPRFRVTEVNEIKIGGEQMAEELKYDNLYGNLSDDIHYDNAKESLMVNNVDTKIHSEALADEIPWERCTIVFECTGQFTTIETATQLLHGCVRKVVVCAFTNNIPEFVVGSNHTQGRAETHSILCHPEPIVHAIAPFLELFENELKVSPIFSYTDVQAMKSTQRCVDEEPKDVYTSVRGCINNIIRSTDCYCLSLNRVAVPPLDPYCNSGNTFHVPTSGISMVSLEVFLFANFTKDQILELIKAHATTDLRDIIGYAEKVVPGYHYRNDTHAATADLSSLMVEETEISFICWYDNVYGYTAQLLRLAIYINDTVV